MKSWMVNNRLKLNDSKTEVLVVVSDIIYRISE